VFVERLHNSLSIIIVHGHGLQHIFRHLSIFHFHLVDDLVAVVKGESTEAARLPIAVVEWNLLGLGVYLKALQVIDYGLGLVVLIINWCELDFLII